MAISRAELVYISIIDISDCSLSIGITPGNYFGKRKKPLPQGEGL
jgi:hypothetical protein